jgi:hypothetical protein
MSANIQLVEQQRASSELKEQIAQLEKLVHKLNTCVSATLGRVDVHAACKYSLEIDALRHKINSNICKFM